MSICYCIRAGDLCCAVMYNRISTEVDGDISHINRGAAEGEMGNVIREQR